MNLIIAKLAALKLAVLGAFAATPAVGSSDSHGLLGVLVSLVMVPFIWAFVRKRIAKAAAENFTKLVRAGLEAGDEDDDVLILAIAHWIEKKAEKLGASNGDRPMVIAKWICERVKFLRGRESDLADLIKDILAEVIEAEKGIENPPPPPPPQP